MEKSTKLKRNLKILMLILLMPIVIWTIMEMIIWDFNNMFKNEKVGEYTNKTEYGDEFNVIVEKGGISQVVYFHNVYWIDQNGKQKFIHRYDSSNADHIEFVTLYDSEDLRCYYVQDQTIVYKEKRKYNYNSIYVGTFKNITVDEKDKVLVPFANYMFLKGEWEWIEIFAEFLIKVNDSKAIETLIRYSRGQFSKQEIQTNEYSTYTKKDIQNFSINILKKFSLNIE